jgi:membrane protein
MEAASPPPDPATRWGRPRRRPVAARLRFRDLTPRRFVDAVSGFLDHHMNDWAAALTFYAAISLLPALVIVVGVLGLLNDSTLESLASHVRDQNDGPIRELTLDALEEVGRSAVSAGLALLVGVFGALWSASSYVGGFLRASGVIHGRAVRYPIWKLRPLQLALTGAAIVAIAGTALFVVVTGPVARDVASAVGLESVWAEAWDLAKWPLIVLFVLSIFAVLYWAAPDVRRRGFQLVTPGGAVATFTWVVGSVGYAIYVESIADYNRLYGSLGAVIGFLVWLWLSNMAMLYGVELNSQLEEGSAGAGVEQPATDRVAD